MNELETYITHLLMKMGFRPALAGFAAIRECVKLSIENKHANLTKIYAMASENLNTGRACVERSVRHALEQMRNKETEANWSNIFECKISLSYITAGDIIAYLTEYIMMNFPPLLKNEYNYCSI